MIHARELYRASWVALLIAVLVPPFGGERAIAQTLPGITTVPGSAGKPDRIVVDKLHSPGPDGKCASGIVPDVIDDDESGNSSSEGVEYCPTPQERKQTHLDQQRRTEADYGKPQTVAHFIAGHVQEGKHVAVIGLIHCTANQCFLHDSQHPLSILVPLDMDSLSDQDTERALKCAITDAGRCSVTVRGSVEQTRNPNVPLLDPLLVEWANHQAAS